MPMAFRDGLGLKEEGLLCSLFATMYMSPLLHSAGVLKVDVDKATTWFLVIFSHEASSIISTTTCSEILTFSFKDSFPTRSMPGDCKTCESSTQSHRTPMSHKRKDKSWIPTCICHRQNLNMLR